MKMTESKLEKMAGYTALVGVGVATIGEFAAGLYEGYTGYFKPEESPTLVVGIFGGYISQLVAGATVWKSDDEMQKTIAVPVVPLLSVVCYGAGYGIGKLFQ